MTSEQADFIALVDALLERGAIEVHACNGDMRATFAPRQLVPARHGKPRPGPEPGEHGTRPPEPVNPDDARRAFYDRVMGEGER